MKTSILVPLSNDALLMPKLLRSLTAATRKAAGFEILFVDCGSTDGSASIAEAARMPHSRVMLTERAGQAEALNRAIAETSGELVLFLGAHSQPQAGWARGLEAALGKADLVVGNTLSLLAAKPSAYGRLAAKLFDRHSERTAHAHGHALPWGPACNLGARRSLLEKTGPFSLEAGTAYDIDWCWRAMLAGARIAYSPAAKVKQLRPNDRRELLEQFERFGLGESWLHRTYSYLLDPEDRQSDPLLSGVDAFTRLRHHSQAAKAKPLAAALDEVAAAFATGVRLGYERPHQSCPLDRIIPAVPLSWDADARSTAVFVPGKGLAVLTGKQRQLFSAIRGGAGDHDLVHLFMRLFKATHHEAEHEVAEFRSSLKP